MFRQSAVVGALVLMAAACSDADNVVHIANIATVRLVNDTDTPLSLNTGSVLDSVNARLVFSQSSTCALVDLSSVPALTVTNAETGALIAFTPTLFPGANLMVVAFRGGDSLSSIQFAALGNRFVPITNTAGLRFFNGVRSPGPLLMARSGAPLTPLVGFGSASGFVSVSTDSASITFSDQTSVVLDAGRMAFPLGENSTVVLGPPGRVNDPIRFFTARGC